ncbi:MAG: hypothetical protein CFH43_01098 [Proteobacteria bacterium]|nr:MAG: hypothetical protein CFH43_01098 [Pseudomonadota bacterium]
MNNKNRRANKTASDADLYKVSKSSIKEFIKKERRHDELDRLREVQSQARVWRRVVLFCGLLNLLLISLAVWGL